MPEHDEWHDTLIILAFEVALALSHVRYDLKDECPNLWNSTDVDPDPNAPYTGVIITLEDGRKVKVSLEPVS
jgi:hypothetical protein